MIKAYVKFFIRLGIVIGLYFLLANIFENRFIILGIFLAIGLVYLVLAMNSTKNHSGYLEIVLNPELHYNKIEKLNSEIDTYNLLKAYGLYYEGLFNEAKVLFDQVNYQVISKETRLDFTYRIIQLGLLFEESNIEEYKAVYQKALDENVFLKNRIHKDIFKVKEYVLEEKYEEAVELAVLIIPKVQPRLFVIELEYLLARSYFELNKLDDCNAVAEFINEKDYKVMFTAFCREYLVKMNRKIY